MIKVVRTKQELRTFIHWVKVLYRNHEHYVFPLFRVLEKDLIQEVLVKNKYTALLCFQEEKITGRLLYTFDSSKHENRTVCYFSFFESIDDFETTQELFACMESDMEKNHISYSEGTFAPYDPDTRRGILIEGFDMDPTLFTSYNHPYYPSLLEQYGYQKKYDTFTLKAFDSPDVARMLNTIGKHFRSRHDIRVDSLNLRALDRDLEDIHQIFNASTNDIMYQEAPSLEKIAEVAKKMRFFIEPTFIKIARDNQTNRPLGFCVVIPDFNQVFKKSKGRIRPLLFWIQKRNISKARGMLQYVIPEYQSTGLIGYMFQTIYAAFQAKGITDFEAGTMMEENVRAQSVFDKLGGTIIKTYRIYGKEISK